ncbi:collagen alpha-1(I) chain-like protein, partial [Lates japonicus]
MSHSPRLAPLVPKKTSCPGTPKDFAPLVPQKGSVPWCTPCFWAPGSQEGFCAPGTPSRKVCVSPGTSERLRLWYLKKGKDRGFGWAHARRGALFGLVPRHLPLTGAVLDFVIFLKTQSKSRRPWYSGSRRGATTIWPHPSPFTNGFAHRPKPAIWGQPKIRSATVSVLPELALGHRLTGVPPQSNSPPATVPGAGHARRGRLLDARSESLLGARLTG